VTPIDERALLADQMAAPLLPRVADTLALDKEALQPRPVALPALGPVCGDPLRLMDCIIVTTAARRSQLFMRR
jgi:hypothetical protein